MERSSLPSPEYWAARMEEVMAADIERTDATEAKLMRMYDKALKSIQQAVQSFVSMYAGENGMTYQAALVYLNRDEFKTWRMDIEEYIAQIEKTGDEALLLELNTLAGRSRIQRMEALMAQIKVEISLLKQKQLEATTAHLTTTAAETYMQTNFAISQGIGMLTAATVLPTKAIDTILEMPWSGDNYSGRIWKDRQRLVWVLEEELTQHFMQGRDIRQTSKALAERMDASKFNATRLIRTESSFVANQAMGKSYEDVGIKKYQFLATLDRRTSSVCQNMDNKVFDLADKQVGVNYPPLHPNCRSSSVPFFSDPTGLRIARDKNGKTIRVPATMTYEQWKKEYIEKG
jgi:SPP1 gp7 family putative phage head morphogenesis protein